MKQKIPPINCGEYLIKLATLNDKDAYITAFFKTDQEVLKFTGSNQNFTKEQVNDFFSSIIDDEDRYDFLILTTDGTIIGESVINEIDWDLRSANFRIGIFNSLNCGKGVGKKVIPKTLSIAFDILKLHRLELEVFDFNIRAYRSYLSAGFKQEGVLRDAAFNGDQYYNVITMSILEDEWKAMRNKKGNYYDFNS